MEFLHVFICSSTFSFVYRLCDVCVIFVCVFVPTLAWRKNRLSNKEIKINRGAKKTSVIISRGLGALAMKELWMLQSIKHVLT